MAQTSFDKQIVSDSAGADKSAAAIHSIQKFLEDHYSQSAKPTKVASDAESQEDIKKKIVDALHKEHRVNDDLNHLLKKNPIYGGTDTNYVEKEWKAGAVDSPTDKQKIDADAKLKDSINPLLKDSDKAALNKAQEAILKGEPKDLSDVLGEYKNNPEKLKAFVDEFNKNFERNNAYINLKVQGDHVKLSGGTGGGYAEVDFDAHTGKSSATFGTLGRASFDGTISKDPETVMKRFGSSAVQSINKSSD